MANPSYGTFYFQQGGGGSLYGIGVYAFAAITHLFGPARCVIGAGVNNFEHQKRIRPKVMTNSVSAEGYDQPWPPYPPRDMDVKQGACDNTFTIIHFNQAFFGYVTANYSTFHGPTPRGIRIFGTEGTICIEAETPLSVVRREGALRSVVGRRPRQRRGGVLVRSRSRPGAGDCFAQPQLPAPSHRLHSRGYRSSSLRRMGPAPKRNPGRFGGIRGGRESTRVDNDFQCRQRPF